MNKKLVAELRALWVKHEDDYTAFDKAMREVLAKELNVPPQTVQRHVSYSHILDGKFRVAIDPRYGLAAIVFDDGNSTS